jgi:hypothetical protein
MGPALSEDKTINIGVAAHITAAAIRGPRYDAALTPEQRKGASNGIWLCQTCSNLIDKDEARYTVPILQKWKREAEQRAFTAIASGRRYGVVVPNADLDEDDLRFLRDLRLGAEDTIEAVEVRMRAAATAEIAAFQSVREWPAHTVALNLTLQEPKQSLSLDGLAAALGVAEALSIVSYPGTGKSTTLVQLADRILASDGPVPLFIPLGEWSDREGDFFDFLIRHNAFRPFVRGHFQQLAYHGRIALLLDGWNELDPVARTRATRDLKALQREFPLLPLVIGTRRYVLPVAGPVVEIEPLSVDQQIELARALRGVEGEALLDQAWRTPGVHELVSVPLYLNALMSSVTGQTFPETKAAVLAIFVAKHEAVPEKAGVLRRDVMGFHADILRGMSVEANRIGNPTLSDEHARRTISMVVKRLIAEGQLGAPLQPGTVLDALVDAHILVRPPGSGVVSFQHQQFQEWYGSFEVERLMVLASQSDAAARDRLRTEILDWPSWEESILFACDRLSRADAAGARAVALAIEETLGIDPMLAANMIFRSAPTVWSHIADRMVRFARRWHVPGTVDRAVRFMLTSGRPEFAALLWPLISNADDQVHLEALRGTERFRPAVLGSDGEALLRSLPDAVRKNVLSEIASNSSFDGMELAATLATQDPNTEVVVAVIHALKFRHADRHVNRILGRASDDVWRTVAEEDYLDELTDAALNTRLAAEREKVAGQNKNDPARVLWRLTRGNPANATGKIAALVGSRDFAAAVSQTGHALGRAIELFPAEVAAGMVERIVADLPLPYDVETLLDSVATIDSGPVADIVLDPTTSDDRLNAAVSIVGPKVVGALIDRFLDMHDQFASKNWQLSEAERNGYHRLEALIALSRQESFLAAWLERATSAPPPRIRVMAAMFVRHGRNSQPKPPPISGEGNRSALRAVLTGWIDAFLAAPGSNSGDFAVLVRAVERLADAHFAGALHAMLERDFKHSEAALAAFIASRGGGSRNSDDSTHKMQYQHAFAALAGPEVIAILTGYLPDLRFGYEAAAALSEIWRQTHPMGEKKPFGWNDFTTVTARRAERHGSDSPPTSDFAEAILATVRLMGDPGKSDAEQKHAIGLATVALGLPHGNKREDIDRLLGLPQPTAFSQRLATTIVLAGEIIPASFLMTGVRELLEIAKTEAWRLADNRGELMGWIELFPFSDNPAAVIEAISLLPEYHQEPWQLRRLLESIPHAPASAALDLLERLAVWSRPIMDLYEWLNALLKLRTEASSMVLLAHIGEGHLNKTATNEFRTAEVLASLAQTYPAVRDDLLQRCRSMPPGAPKSLIERAVAELGTDEALIVLLETFAADGRRDNGLLANAIRKLAIGQRPADGWAGAYEEFSVPLTSFRKRLFAMISPGDARAPLAEYCLNEIEEHRNRLGRINNEPRHPDITSGRPWPNVAAESGVLQKEAAAFWAATLITESPR